MAATNRNPKVAEAGHKLRQIREDKKMVLRDVENETLRRYGEGGVIRMAQLSRIEKGSFDRVSLDDACHLAEIYGMTPEEIGALYGVWHTTSKEDQRPRALRDAENLARSLDGEARDELLSWIEFAVMQARAKTRTRHDLSAVGSGDSMLLFDAKQS